MTSNNEPTTFPHHTFYLTLLPLTSPTEHENFTREARERRRQRFRNLSLFRGEQDWGEDREPFPTYIEPEMPMKDERGEEGTALPARPLVNGTDGQMHEDLQMLGVRGLVARANRERPPRLEEGMVRRRFSSAWGRLLGRNKGKKKEGEREEK